MLKAGKLLTLNNTNRVLLEFSFTREPEDILDIIYNFNINGYEVIIAHVERYEWMDYSKVVALRNEGALIQINSNSYLGLTTWKEKRFVKKLLKHNLVDFVASDTHSFRPSTLDKSYKKIKNPDLFNYVR
jgi:protein-tyrosine phosphatase